MTAPANAFASGIDLDTVESGAEMRREWGIRFVA